MAKSHSFWLIIDGAVPTAFRAKKREDLLPTLAQLKRTRPTVVLMWFERGRVWESPAAARSALDARRRDPRPRDRKPEWRPGGEHRDPRAKYQLSRDEKRARFKKRRDFDRREPGRDDRGPRPSARDQRGSDRRDSRPRQYSDTAGGDRRKAGDRPSPHARGGWKPRSGESGGRKSRPQRPGGWGGKGRQGGPKSSGERRRPSGPTRGAAKRPWRKPKPDKDS